MPLVTLPQFTERESKIAGPLTFRQFISLVLIGAIAGSIYLTLPRSFGLPISLLILIGGGILAVVEIDKTPLYSLLLKRLGFFLSSKTFVWGKGKLKQPTATEIEIKKIEKNKIKIKKGGNLKNLMIRIETKK
jgi:hypothetical protein